MTIEQMIYQKQRRGYSYEQLAKLSGVPQGTIQKIFVGQTKSPRYDTLRALEQVFKPEENEQVSEPAIDYGIKIGPYTLDDYYALPDEQRVELIDGEFYDMAAPSVYHQRTIMTITREIWKYIEAKKGQCEVLNSPIDVQLDCDDKTMVQPDLLVLCDKDKITKRCIYGAPDWIVEVLSGSNWKKDVIQKSYKYCNAGVREYWVVDIDKKRILVYDWTEEDLFPTIYGEEDEIPVAIYNGDLRISVKKIFDGIQI